jgi:hypothetical protein
MNEVEFVAEDTVVGIETWISETKKIHDGKFKL